MKEKSRKKYTYSGSYSHSGSYSYESLSALALAQRGICCGNGCTNCCYVPRHGGAMAKLSFEGKRLLDEKTDSS